MQAEVTLGLHLFPVGRGIDADHRLQEVNGVQHRTDCQNDQRGEQLPVGNQHSRLRKQQLADKAGEQRNAHHGKRCYQETKTCHLIPVSRAGQFKEAAAAAGNIRQADGRYKQQGFGSTVGQHMEDARNGTHLRSQAQAHIDVADLGH